MGGVTNRLVAAAQSSVEGDTHASEKLADELRRQHFDCVDLLIADDQKRSELKRMPSIAGRTFSALGKRGVNIIAIAQGSSEYNVSFVVHSDSMAEAVQELHKEFGLMRSDYSEV
jgi:aspartokinase